MHRLSGKNISLKLMVISIFLNKENDGIKNI